ncbi:APC family permease [Acidipila sp. EB88]|uniref:APC family permease n=1 Tax=Acidipila sp. EB88 TaxID=2305226 RepID=UPI000F5D88C7|nr:APC family permease [Acidipila sp. EB88]RRA47427.1 APC family permease [Acidipila sp. EB88]
MQTSSSPEHSLKRQLRLRDLVLTQILCVVGSSWVGIAAGLGRAELLMWAAAMILFYAPLAGSVIALNRNMPLEGGLYAWSRIAFGELAGFLTAWNLWVYGIAVTATILYAIPTELAYLIGPKAAWLPENHGASLAVVGCTILVVTGMALRGLEVSKWLHNAGGFAILVVFATLILLPLWAHVHHEPVRWSPLTMALPPLSLHSLALFGQMLFGALCGLEYIAILAGESSNPARTIGQSVWISSPVICAMFILGTGSIEAFTRGSIDYIAPIPQTLRLALGSTGAGSVFAAAAILLLQIRLLGAASFLFTGVTRLPMVAGWDSLVPRWFTRMHPRWKTPSNSILFTSALVCLLVLMASIGVHAQEAFQLLSNASLTHYEVAYLFMFAVPFLGSRALRTALPGWLRWSSLVGFVATLFSLLISAYPFVDVVNARLYAGKIIGVVVGSNLAGICFYQVRTRMAHAQLSETEPATLPIE